MNILAQQMIGQMIGLTKWLEERGVPAWVPFAVLGLAVAYILIRKIKGDDC